MLKYINKNNLSEFFKDAQGRFNVYSVISLLSGFTLVSSPLVIRLFKWPLLIDNEFYSLTFIYCIAVLSEHLLVAVINKMPGPINVNKADTVNIESVDSQSVPKVE
ncbi:hypothetical protein F1C16_05245 [Hymenobacter sp. NBH84]|uniref:hypothetical protein n=1 Tax=Hymenobacter sp. NBH84 TaxID=2596915 RepID=UPI001628A33F|nr:hypothetical protein [Hymenobacter sp. NBH84]QNE39001.1 hypothetical protein F1C16_05245 [Hymenobacter sp. NBH84]